MMLYDWPGNVRELQNAIERAVVVGKENRIMPADLPILGRVARTDSLPQRLDEIEKSHIRKILSETGWNIARSAQILGIDRSTLYHKIKRYQLQRTA
jgi:transcriptional regulator of acetoin/glycerol metabolism